MKTNNKIEASAPANKPAKVQNTINLKDCWFEWQFDDGTKCEDLFKAHVERKNIYAVVSGWKEGTKAEIYKENRCYCHIDDAWRILMEGQNKDKLAKWKTTDILKTLRQALRERFAQCMSLEIPETGIGQKKLQAWLTIARHYDAIHHGQATF